MTTVSLLYFAGCPNWEVAHRRLRELQAEAEFTLELRRVETPEEAERSGFRGSPTILLDGDDPFTTGDEPTGLACRIYDTPVGTAGAPTLEQLRAVLA